MKLSKGTKLTFDWTNKGFTPGKVVDIIDKKLFVVKWDDGTTTKTSKMFLLLNTVEGKKHLDKNAKKNKLH